MDYPVTDLTNCDKEPIHIPGKVQPHGFLVGFNMSDEQVLFTSNNLAAITGIHHESIINRRVIPFLDQLNLNQTGKSLLEIIRFGSQNNFETLNPAKISINGKPYYLICSLSGGSVMMEFEPAFDGDDFQLQSLIGSSLSKILNGRTLAETVQAAAKQVKNLINYDRVMIYQFWEDGHGEVIAEQKNDDLEPFFGLHYPASDIPSQARELYKLNLTRIIADVNAIPAEIVVAESQATRPVDLTNSVLRAVSPIHIEYLKNMGVAASFSVSIIHNGELWGLIACHNYTPRFIDYKARDHARLIGQVLSSSFEYKASQDQKEEAQTFMVAASSVTTAMLKNWDLVSAVTTPDEPLLKITSATGAALVYEGKVYKQGKTPGNQQILDLVSWLSNHERPIIYNTNNLSRYYLPAKKYVDTASGLLACSISKELGEYILFFKPEVLKTVNWAGDPHKKPETDATGTMKLSPRRSFAVWAQEVQETSQKWSRAELNTAVKFREDVVHFVNLRSNEIRKLNEKLQEAYDELDAFSFTISHDLKTPLASVKNYAELLLEEFPDLGPVAVRYLGRIIKSGEKMENLIQEVLGYSRVSRQRLIKEEVHLSPVLDEIRTEIISAYKASHVDIHFKQILNVKGDRVMITQVFSNVLSNAVKYSAKANRPVVTVNATETETDIIYTIEDNGIGIDMNYGGQIFELFKRMENSAAYSGSGVGLAIVKRIMTKHGGKIWYESSNDGTVFYLSFTKA